MPGSQSQIYPKGVLPGLDKNSVSFFHTKLSHPFIVFMDLAMCNSFAQVKRPSQN